MVRWHEDEAKWSRRGAKHSLCVAYKGVGRGGATHGSRGNRGWRKLEGDGRQGSKIPGRLVGRGLPMLLVPHAAAAAASSNVMLCFFLAHLIFFFCCFVLVGGDPVLGGVFSFLFALFGGRSGA